MKPYIYRWRIPGRWFYSAAVEPGPQGGTPLHLASSLPFPTTRCHLWGLLHGFGWLPVRTDGGD